MGSGSTNFSSNWSLITRSRILLIVAYLQFSLPRWGRVWGGGLDASSPSPLTPLPVGEGKERFIPRVLQRATDVVSILPVRAQSRNCRGARKRGQSGPQ